jgi:predicted kinase
VVVDACFGNERQRLAFLDAAARWAVPALILICKADSETIRRRLETRTGDASDADWAVYLHASEHWEPLGLATLPLAVSITTGEHPDHAVTTAMTALRSRDLLG